MGVREEGKSDVAARQDAQHFHRGYRHRAHGPRAHGGPGPGLAAPHEVVVCATNAVQVIVDQGLSPTSQRVTLPLGSGGCMILDAVFIWVKNPTALPATGSFQDLGLVPSGGPGEANKASP